MARYSYDDAKQAVVDAINAAGGSIAVSELREVLPAEDRREILARLFDMVHDGTIQSVVVAEPDAKPVHTVSIGGN